MESNERLENRILLEMCVEQQAEQPPQTSTPF